MKPSKSMWLVLLVMILPAFTACQKQSQEGPDSPLILLPLDGSYFFHGESLVVQAEASGKSNFSHLELYFDEQRILESKNRILDTQIELSGSGEGAHAIRIVAWDIFGQYAESTVSIQLLSEQSESSEDESFSQDPVQGWFLSGWSVSGTEAYDEGRSLRSSSDQAMAITRHNFEEAGHISFYVKDGMNNLEFLVDGMIKARWFGKEDWGEYAYTIPPGEHVFKWVSREEGTFLDQVSFNPGQIRHTPGEHFEGGIIYHLDSTGQHGLIAALQDGTYQGRPEIPWGCYGVAITSGNRAQSESDGASNTRAIVSSCEMDQNAARYCYDYSIEQDASTWDDWYLPAITEVRLLYAQRHLMENLGGDYYWTSTSFSTHAASVIDFRDGSHHGAHRNIPNVSGPVAAGIYVRPVRGF